jgi:hypothetical protein
MHAHASGAKILISSRLNSSEGRAAASSSGPVGADDVGAEDVDDDAGGAVGTEDATLGAEEPPAAAPPSHRWSCRTASLRSRRVRGPVRRCGGLRQT